MPNQQEIVQYFDTVQHIDTAAIMQFVFEQRTRNGENWHTMYQNVQRAFSYYAAVRDSETFADTMQAVETEQQAIEYLMQTISDDMQARNGCATGQRARIGIIADFKGEQRDKNGAEWYLNWHCYGEMLDDLYYWLLTV